MGIKTILSLEEINSALKNKICFKTIKESSFGATDTVYFCDDEYVLKIYENSSINQINNEILLHERLSDLDISKLAFNEIFYIKNKPSLVFIKSKGKVLDKVLNIHLEQIAVFLKNFHNKSKNINIKNEDIFSKNYLQNSIKETKNKSFQEIFDSLDNLNLKNDGLIHGDLFIDNAIFLDDKLNAVIDFNEVCIGDYFFDLAVVVVSWCSFEKYDEFKKQAQYFLNVYDSSIKVEDLKEYMIYACLYFSVFRELSNRNYDDLMNKISFLKGNMS